MELIIKIERGFWTVNGKLLKDCSIEETKILVNFIKHFQYEKIDIADSVSIN